MTAVIVSPTRSCHSGDSPAAWTPAGLALDLLSALLACALALTSVRRPTPTHGPALRRLRHLHSGHLGDYLAWLALGIAALTAQR
ncbi:hypothetical protein [Kitasatospora camelliae]|uniref:Uncharacterized protein n=1 Tax=Kitasatospora camelliae TaxID=3156397 RepID=A0AAU8K676_9ACTN